MLSLRRFLTHCFNDKIAKRETEAHSSGEKINYLMLYLKIILKVPYESKQPFLLCKNSQKNCR